MCEQCKSLEQQIAMRKIELATRDDIIRRLMMHLDGVQEMSAKDLDEIETYLATNYHTTDWAVVARAWGLGGE